MLPEIEFKYSKIYESHLLKLINKEPISKLEKEIFLNIFEKLNSNKNEIINNLKEITKILNVNWNRKTIRIYCLSFREHNTTFSDPLTISLCTKTCTPIEIEDIVDLITHELIHNALDEMPETKNALKKLKNDFPELAENSYSHILVYSVHYLIYEKMKKLNRQVLDKTKTFNKSDYFNAWVAVEKHGAKNILLKYLFSE
ncbi:MAG: hypothetical protein Q7S21_00095 [archaeon]|nr:hypothetical protein [archaeon]